MKESIVMLSEKEKAGRGSNALNSSSLYLKKVYLKIFIHRVIV